MMDGSRAARRWGNRRSRNQRVQAGMYAQARMSRVASVAWTAIQLLSEVQVEVQVITPSIQEVLI